MNTTTATNTTAALTAAEAQAELDRRAYNRTAKKDGNPRREAASDAAFTAGSADLKAIIANAPATEPSIGFLNWDGITAHDGTVIDAGDEVPARFASFICCTEECGGCVNGEICASTAGRIASGEHEHYDVATCGHGGECASLARR